MKVCLCFADAWPRVGHEVTAPNDSCRCSKRWKLLSLVVRNEGNIGDYNLGCLRVMYRNYIYMYNDIYMLYYYIYVIQCVENQNRGLG